MSHEDNSESQISLEQSVPGQPPGEILAQAREREGLSRLQASEKLGLTETAIRDIELSRFEKFPSGIYVRGYIRNYSRLVGIDAEQVLRSYDQYGKTHDTPDESPFGHASHLDDDTKNKQKLMLIVGACVLVGLLMFAIFLDM